jgi:hypothetical protein
MVVAPSTFSRSAPLADGAGRYDDMGSGDGTIELTSEQTNDSTASDVKNATAVTHFVLESADSPDKGDAVHIEDRGDSIVAISCAYGKYVTAHSNGGISANADEVGPHEEFTKEEHPDGSMSLLAFNQKYLSVDRSGRIHSSSSVVGDAEKFLPIRRPKMNFALGRPATSSSVLFGGVASRATDGKDNHGVFVENGGVCAHTKNQTPSWIRSDLQQYVGVAALTLTGRDLQGANQYSKGWSIRIGNGSDFVGELCADDVDASGGKVTEIACKKPYPKGRYVTVWSKHWIVLCELQVFKEDDPNDNAVFLRTSQGKFVAIVEARLSADSNSPGELFNAGYTLKDLKEAGFKPEVLKREGFGYDELRDVGFYFHDLTAAGFGPDAYGAYPFLSTTHPPADVDPSKVGCDKGQSFRYWSDIPGNVPKYAGLPDRDKWEHLWDKLFLGSKPAQCNTPVMAVTPLGEGGRGFGSLLNGFVNEALVAMTTGWQFAVCAPQGSKNYWSKIFVDPGLLSCASCTAPSPGTEVGLWAAGAATSHSLASSPHLIEVETYKALKRFLHRKMFVLKPEYNESLENVTELLDLGSGPYIGVHIRRGDKIREAGFFRHIWEFANEAKRLCELIGANKIFVASDDGSVLEKFTHHINNKSIQVVEQPRLPPEAYAERGYYLKRSTERALVNDMMLLARADAYVGTASSNLDRWVFFTRDPATQSISMDDGGDFLRRSC